MSQSDLDKIIKRAENAVLLYSKSDFLWEKELWLADTVIKLATALDAFANIAASDGDALNNYAPEVILRVEITAGELANARQALKEAAGDKELGRE